MKVRLYCTPAATSETAQIRPICPHGGRTNQTRARAATAKRHAISRIGGKCSSAALAKTMPMPQTSATATPIAMSTGRSSIMSPPNERTATRAVRTGEG